MIVYHFNQIYYLATAQFLCFAFILQKRFPSFLGVLSVTGMILPFLYIYPNSDHHILFILKAFSLLNFSLFIILKHNRVLKYNETQIFLMFLYLSYSILMIISHLGFINELDKVYNLNLIYPVVLSLVVPTLIWKDRFISFITQKLIIILLLITATLIAIFQIDTIVFLVQSIAFFLMVIIFYIVYQFSGKSEAT